MTTRHGAWIGGITAGMLGVGLAGAGGTGGLEGQREALLSRLESVHHLSPAQLARIRAIFQASIVAGQGNPAVTVHPMTPEQCQSRVSAAGAHYENPTFEAICGGPYMAPLYDPATQRPEDAAACIDLFEFPDIPCEYPVVWVRAREAAEICTAMGKRLCDAHEWEGACQGDLDLPDYNFALAKGKTPSAAVGSMRASHNRAAAATKRWSYGKTYQEGICGGASSKSDGCNGGDWKRCGSNTYPAGAFPECRSPLGVLDLNGNAAEHMNLPLAPSEMSSMGSTSLGYTEMKGSWFIFDTYYAHEDWCRWRAPYWHGSRVMAADSHHNYHLGFRCCKTVKASTSDATEGVNTP